MKKLFLTNPTFWKYTAMTIIVAGVVSAVLRFTLGLGATTNLSDTFPWGLWIGFDFIGVGLAASGFTIAAAVHIFHVHRFEPIVRPAILMAFIGYMLVILVLVIDLGRPENFWHPLVMWNPHSVMFEITWCVILYSTVLALEFAPVVLEKFQLHRPIKILKMFSLPVVILGVLFSTLHQSSFGSLYLIVPGRLHPLWYSTLMPILFFISCIAAGLSMINFVSYLSTRITKRMVPKDISAVLGKVVAVVLALYLVVRLEDMSSRNVLHHAFEGTYQSIFFLLEIGLGFITPMILLMIRPVRESQRGIVLSSILVLLGFASNRMNTAVTGMEIWPTTTYFPSVIESLITLGIATIGFVGFYFVAKYFPIFVESEAHDPQSHSTVAYSWHDDLKKVSTQM